MAVERDAVIELRRYTLHPGRRDALIDLFDRHLVEPQEEVGMHVIGQFRDLDDPDQFVWLRGFDGMRGRVRGLEAFYGGPVWRTHREAANATMRDSSNALLLAPVVLGPAYPDLGAPRPPVGATAVPASVVTATVADRRDPDGQALVDLFTGTVQPILADTGAELAAAFVTDPSPNDFPALPVRAAHVLVWLARFPDDEAHAEHRRLLRASSTWTDRVRPALLEHLTGEPRELRLRPSVRSQLR